MEDVVGSVFDLMGRTSDPIMEEEFINQRVDIMFEVIQILLVVQCNQELNICIYTYIAIKIIDILHTCLFVFNLGGMKPRRSPNKGVMPNPLLHVSMGD